MSHCKSKAFPCELGVNKASTIGESDFDREIVGV